jgi:hypothetical protein
VEDGRRRRALQQMPAAAPSGAGGSDRRQVLGDIAALLAYGLDCRASCAINLAIVFQGREQIFAHSNMRESMINDLLCGNNATWRKAEKYTQPARLTA